MNNAKTITLILCVFVYSVQAHAATHYVDLTCTNPQSPYLTWETAATNIQHAVDAATQADIVLVTNGTYHISSQITVTNGITLTSVNGPGQTIVNADYSCRCFYLGQTQTVLKGFTVIKGKEYQGEGIFCLGARVSQCIIDNNTARNLDQYNLSAKGCGIFLENGTLDRCQIVNNCHSFGTSKPGVYPSSSGGGIYGISSHIKNSIIKGNNIYFSSMLNGGMQGGGACLTSSEVVNCFFENNAVISGYSLAAPQRGGIYATENCSLINCTVISNRALGNDISVGYENRHGGRTFFRKNKPNKQLHRLLQYLHNQYFLFTP